MSISSFNKAVLEISFTAVKVDQVSNFCSSSCELNFAVKLLSYFYLRLTACLQVPSFESSKLLASTSCCRLVVHSY